MQWLSGKESACNVGDGGGSDMYSIPGLGRYPGEGNGYPLPFSCWEKPHGQRSLVGYSPQGCKESETTECSTWPLKSRQMEWSKMLVTWSCSALFNPIYCIPPGFSILGIPQPRILKWLATPFSRGSSQPRDPTRVSCVAGRFFTVWATRKPSRQMAACNTYQLIFF